MNVWYNSTGIAPPFNTTFEDKGMLTISNDNLEYIGKKHNFKIASKDILDVTSGKLKGNPVGGWISVRITNGAQPVTHYFRENEEIREVLKLWNYRWGDSHELHNAIKDLINPPKECPHCHNYINFEALVCEHCGLDQPLSPSRI